MDTENLVIRPVVPADAGAITEIYNYYIKETTITFETEPMGVEEMASRIEETAAQFPYLVCEEDGRVLGYCYAHLWKQRAAYSKTLEVTVYLDRNATRRGLGKTMVRRLIERCRELGYHALVACITRGNDASVKMFSGLGFGQVSAFKEVGCKFGHWLDVIDLEMML